MPTAQFLSLSVLNVTDIQQFQNVLHLEQQKDVHSQHRLSFHPLLATEEIWLGLKAEFLRALPRSTTSSRSSRYRDCYVPSPPWVEQRNRCGCVKPTSLPTNLVEARHQLRFAEDAARWDPLSFPVQKERLLKCGACLQPHVAAQGCVTGGHALTSRSTSLDLMPLISAKVFKFSFTVKTSNCMLVCGQMPTISLISSLSPISESL